MGLTVSSAPRTHLAMMIWPVGRTLVSSSTDSMLSEIYQEITDQFGSFEMAERDYRFTQQRKEQINDLLMVRRELPAFSIEVDHVSYLDGCKVYFKNGGWIICRFSGTEPLIRIFCEMSTLDEANRIADEMKAFLAL